VDRKETKQIQKVSKKRTENQMLRSVLADLTEIAALATFVGFIAILA
jgi:hypothetical protein